MYEFEVGSIAPSLRSGVSGQGLLMFSSGVSFVINNGGRVKGKQKFLAILIDRDGAAEIDGESGLVVAKVPVDVPKMRAASEWVDVCEYLNQALVAQEGLIGAVDRYLSQAYRPLSAKMDQARSKQWRSSYDIGSSSSLVDVSVSCSVHPDGASVEVMTVAAGAVHAIRLSLPRMSWMDLLGAISTIRWVSPMRFEVRPVNARGRLWGPAFKFTVDESFLHLERIDKNGYTVDRVE